MQRVGEQEQSRDQFWLFGTEHAGLASAVGVAAEEDALRHSFHRGNGIYKSGTITDRIARSGRAVVSRLPIREVAAQHAESGGGEDVGKCDQQWGCGI